VLIIKQKIMNRIKLLLSTVLLVVPFMGTWAYNSDGDLDVNGTLTYTITWSGGQFYWYATTHNYNDTNGGYENCHAAKKLILKCSTSGILNNSDISALRTILAANSSLVELDLSNATFKNDTGNYGSYTDSWGSTIWGCCASGVVGDAMFHDCTHLQTVTLPSNTTKIGHGAFFKCTSLKNVYYYGNSLTTIDRECFMWDSQLQTLSGDL